MQPATPTKINSYELSIGDILTLASEETYATRVSLMRKVIGIDRNTGTLHLSMLHSGEIIAVTLPRNTNYSIYRLIKPYFTELERIIYDIT